MRSPGIDQRAIQIEMLITGVLRPLSQRLDVLKNKRAVFWLKRRSRFWQKVESSHTRSSIDRPKNQRKSRLESSCNQLALGAHGVNYLQQSGPQRVILGDALFQRRVAEQVVLLEVGSMHRLDLPLTLKKMSGSLPQPNSAWPFSKRPANATNLPHSPR